MWVKGPTAIVVIHGMGEQKPFDILDEFTCKLLPVLDTVVGSQELVKKHRIVSRKEWNENYVSIYPEGEEKHPLDVYEYYWANEAENQIDMTEVYEWLVQVGDSARKYYEDNQMLADYYEGIGDKAFGRKSVLSGKKAFKKYWYLRYSGFFFRLLSYLLALIGPALDKLPSQVGQPLKWAVSAAGRFIGNKIAKSFGDVVLYTTTDSNSRYYAVRKKILDGSVAKIRQLMTETVPVEYNSIIIIGHSLGSVIAYDTINRINHDLNTGKVAISGVTTEKLAAKIKGFVTFGSPLDKIAFFLRARAGKEQHIKEQIQSNFHSFRAKHWNPMYQPPEKLQLDSDIFPYLDNMKWLNFWDAKDPVAGALDFYLVDYVNGKNNKKEGLIKDGERRKPSFEGNIQVKLGAKTPWAAHSGYWDHIPMYLQIVDDIILQ